MNNPLLARVPKPVSTARLIAFSAALGAAIGVLAVFAYRFGTAAEVFMSQLGLFIIVPAIAGLFALSRRDSAVAATSVLLVMCLVYYAPYASSFASYAATAVVWTVLSLLAGPVFGIAGFLLRRDSRGGALAASALIGLLLGETVRMCHKGLTQGDLDLLALTVTFDAVSATALLLLVRSSRKQQVALLAVPMTALGYIVTFALR